MTRPTVSAPTPAAPVPARIAALAAALALTATLAPPPTPLAAQRAYPASAHGGNYMHNFHFPPAPSSSPWYPEWHPGGERVAVAMSGSLWEVDIATGDAFEIVHGPDYYSSPNYSPDGAWLLYTADDGGGTIDLEVMNNGHRRAPPPHRGRPHPHGPPLLAGRQPHRLRLDRSQRLLQHLHPPLRRRCLDRAGCLGHVRQLLRARSPLFWSLGHAHLARVAAERRGTADRLQSRRRTRQRQRLPRSGPGGRHRGPAGRPGRANPLPHPAACLLRRPALRLLLDTQALRTSSRICTSSRPPAASRTR